MASNHQLLSGTAESSTSNRATINSLSKDKQEDVETLKGESDK